MIRMTALILTLTTLAACETAKGAGRDIQRVGDAISDVASDVQQAF